MRDGQAPGDMAIPGETLSAAPVSEPGRGSAAGAAGVAAGLGWCWLL
jgi:hypothetical protein